MSEPSISLLDEAKATLTTLLNEDRKSGDSSCDVEFHIFEDADYDSDYDNLNMTGKVVAHKVVLKMKSSVFKRQFYGSLSRNIASGPEVVKVKDCSYFGFKSLIDAVYEDNKRLHGIINFYILFDVLKLADRYDIQTVFKHIHKRITAFTFTNADEAFEALKVACSNKDLVGFSDISEKVGRKAAGFLYSKSTSVKDMVRYVNKGFENSNGAVSRWLVRLLLDIEGLTPAEHKWEADSEDLKTTKRANTQLWGRTTELEADIEDLSDDNAKLNAKLNLLQKNLLAKDKRIRALENLEKRSANLELEQTTAKKKVKVSHDPAGTPAISRPATGRTGCGRLRRKN